MAAGFGDRDGGILGLLEFVREREEAVEFELLERGYGLGDIGTMNLSWTELRTLLRRWSVTPGNAVCDAMHDRQWTISEQMLAQVIDLLAAGNYIAMRAAGSKSAKKPKPIPRPWDDKPTTYGKGAIPYDEMDAWLASRTRTE